MINLSKKLNFQKSNNLDRIRILTNEQIIKMFKQSLKIKLKQNKIIMTRKAKQSKKTNKLHSKTNIQTRFNNNKQ